MTKPVWSYVLTLSASVYEESSYSQLPGSLNRDYKYLHARQIPNQLSF